MPADPEPAADTRLLTIGEVARRSGLTASALRFYDREGMLVPADVDALTGYRRYAVAQVRAARLLASLRRVGMPLAEVALVLDEDARGASGTAADVVTAHEQRLVDGLADARREIVRTLALLAEREHAGSEACRVAVRAGELAAALASVRFAVAPGEPAAGAPDGVDLRVLTGILVEVCGEELRCVATDRYRLAVGWAAIVGLPAASPDAPLAAVVPIAWADRVTDACAAVGADSEVVLELRPGRVGATVDGGLVATPVLPGSFPDYRSIVTADAGREGVDAAGLLALLPVERQTVGLVVRDGSVHVAARDDAGADDVADVLVDPEFLHEALSVAGARPTLVLDGPHRPLAVRGEGAGTSVLMPVAAESSGP
ncbi:MerR family transcriptional regulator [Terracoccus sp. 273MFTsu3.1]|uniref:DNA polymerase III subunit beta family protein n=1 Tax=Terracoccus sp. 273MFTsu3.1 TaxID=1172188 RepID=UPI00037E718D|nr:MerR family transcriptional regulator [Terracoccus sp. 273MFTsu3.1]